MIKTKKLKIDHYVGEALTEMSIYGTVIMPSRRRSWSGGWEWWHGGPAASQ